MPAVKLYSNEKIVNLSFAKSPKGYRYALSNYGRIISYITKPEEGKFLKPAHVRGYPSVTLRKKGKRQTFLVHRLVADYFLNKPSSKHKYVLHLNFKKEDNYENNLKWATIEEKITHTVNERRRNESGNYKLTADRVRLIKKKMLNGKTRLKIIAKQFGVSDMQIHRIRTGENWGHIEI